MVLRYQALIYEIDQILTTYEVRLWKDRSGEWQRSFPDTEDDADAWAKHANVVLQSFGGMGSINDVYSSPKAGDRIADDLAVIRDVNQRLKSRLSELCGEATRLSRKEV